MNTGRATPGEKDQVKLNQQTTSDPMQGSVPQAPSAPSAGATPPASTPPPAPPSPPPLPPAPPATPPLDDGEQKKQNIGIGEENIGVEKKLNQPAPPPQPPVEEAKIEIQTYDTSKTTDAAKPVTVTTPPGQPLPTPPSPGSPPPLKPITPAPPIKAGPSPAATIIVLAILALIFGTAGGFFGFRYWDKLKTSASTETSPSPQAKVSAGLSPSATDTSTWQTYTNSQYKFSLKYPSNWVSSTTDPQAQGIVLAANQESLSPSPSSFRVEIVFQAANGQTLKSWVEANATTTNETQPIKEITVSGQTAYQQEQTNLRPAVATYIERSEKVMIVTLTAPPSLMGEAGEWYNSLINSIVLS